MKHIDVIRMNPRYAVTLSKEQLLEIVYRYLSENDPRLRGNIISSYSTGDGGFYLLLEE